MTVRMLLEEISDEGAVDRKALLLVLKRSWCVSRNKAIKGNRLTAKSSRVLYVFKFPK